MKIIFKVLLLGLIHALLLGISEVSCKHGYLFTFPQTLQIGAPEKFCVQFYDVSSSVDLYLNISCYGRSIQHQPKTFLEGESGCFIWSLPQSLTEGTCDLVIKGEDGRGEYTFSEKREIQVVESHQITFIQTDKPVYKPKDTVKFRILTVTQDLKPLKANMMHHNIDSVTVHDPNDFYMRQWLNVHPQAGLVSLEYRLYDEPLLGDWKIVAVVNGLKTEQTFSVEEYVLPKFQVYMKLPEALTVETESFQFEVCARYTFGKPVLGNVNATVCLENTETSWFCESHLRPCAHVNSKINGCHSFKVETKLLSITERQFSLLCRPKLAVHTYVTEKETGLTVDEKQQGAGVWEERVKLKFISDKYFKPFFTYIGKLYAWNPDGSPAAGETVTLTISKLGIVTTLKTDKTGHAYFNIQNLTHSTPYFVLHAKTHDSDYTDKKRYTIFPATTKKHVKQWYSPTSTYVELSTMHQGQRQCGETISIDVVYSLLSEINIQSVILQVISKGNIVDHTNVTKEILRSSPYLPFLKGPVFSPRYSRSPGSGDDDNEENRLQPGPPGGPQSFPAGPPGQASHLGGSPGQESFQPGPPGSVSGSASIPVAPLESIGIANTIEKETKIAEDEAPFARFSDMTPPNLHHFSLRQYISGDMAPKMRVLIYMITNTRELVADTLDIDVEHCYNNQVNMTFKQNNVRPGSQVDLTLKASPGSLCSAGMVDKSVYLHGGVNLLKMSDINDKLREYDMTSDFINDWQYCSDLTVLPPDMTNPGPDDAFGGSPGYDFSTDFIQGPFRRKKRSIMQYYSNMYDALLAFKVAGLEVMTDLDLQTRPCLHNGDILGPTFLPGDPRGPIPGPGGELEGLEPTEEPVDNRDAVTNLRKYFPDTWLWELYEVPDSGSVTFAETIPDTITEWVGNSVCTNEDVGLGISDISRITTFQPFFVSVKLPYSVIRGEIINVDVMVYNYLKHCTAIQVTVVENDKFELINQEAGQMCICSETSKSHTFKIRPTQLGKITMTFSAFLREHRVSCYRAEAPRNYKNKQVTELVVKELLVQAEGVEKETTKSQFVCPQDSAGSFHRKISPELRDDLVVPGSLRGWVTVVGDIMGPVLNGLDDLILLPTGCGEQNMIRLAPNVAVLRYLTLTKQLTSDIEVKTVDHLNKGYQQQLKFMHKDGSYSAFGEADDVGSTWLSAFAFKTLQLALDFTFIDRKQIQIKTWEFLINQQGVDGCFIENGKVLSKYMMGGVIGSRSDKKRALTAYVLVAMLESFKMMKERTPPFVALAVRCIQVDNLTDTYTHALVAYAMTLYKPNSKFTKILLTRLMEKAHIDGDKMYWKREKTPDILSGQGRAASAEIEITAYVLLSLLTKDKNAAISDVMPIVRWLTNQRNANGGFASTQDTVVALQALSVFAQRIYGSGLSVNVNMADNHGVTKDIHVTHKNSIILHQHDLVNPESDLHITAKGEGCVLMQTTYRYSVQNQLIPEDIFKLSVSTPVTKETIQNSCRQRSVKVCASYHGDDEKSNMAVIEVKLISGWIPDVKSLQYLVNSVELGLKKYEMDKRYPDVVNFYFDELDSARLCFEFMIVLEVDVESQQPAVAKVFDYYESELESTIFYEMTPCSEEFIENVDVSINGDSDLYMEGDGQLSVNEHNHLHAAPVKNEGEDKKGGEADLAAGPVGKEMTAPESGPQCPKCVSTGIVNILDNICQKQVWILQPDQELGFSLRVMAADGISPELNIALPEHLGNNCLECENFFLDTGERSMVFLQPYDWTNLGINIAQKSTVIVPWSYSLQTSIQQILEMCSYQ